MGAQGIAQRTPLYLPGREEPQHAYFYAHIRLALNLLVSEDHTIGSERVVYLA